MALDLARLPACPVGAQEAQETAAEGQAVDGGEGGRRHGHDGQDERDGPHDVRSRVRPIPDWHARPESPDSLPLSRC